MAGTTLEVRMLGKYSGGGSGPSANGTFIDLTKDNQTVPAVTEPPGTIFNPCRGLVPRTAIIPES